MLSGRSIVIVAIIVAVAVCGAIIGYFTTRAPTEDPFDKLTQLHSQPPAPLSPAETTTPAEPVPAPEVAAPARETSKEFVAAPPPDARPIYNNDGVTILTVP